MMASIDTLEIAKRLRGAGFDDTQAEAITGALRDTHDADLSRLAMKDDMSKMEARLSAEIKMIPVEMEILRRVLTIRLGGVIFVAAGFLAAIKFFG
jgi:hypothetical protein